MLENHDGVEECNHSWWLSAWIWIAAHMEIFPQD
jgi:hypothetical protein